MSVRQVESQSVFAARLREAPRIVRRRPEATSGRRALERSAARPLPAEIAFLAEYGVPEEALRYAAALARRQGVYADEVLVAEGIVTDEAFRDALAAHVGAERLDLELAPLPSRMALATAAQGYARLRDHPRGLLWLFAPRGPAIARLVGAARGARSRPLFAVSTRAHFLAALRRACAFDLPRMAAHSAERADAELCVRAALRRKALAVAVAANALMLLALVGPFPALSLATALGLAVMFLASVFLRLFACAASFEARERALWLDDAQLPVYTIIVALYKEAAVAGQLARALDALDYPVLCSNRTNPV